MAFAFSLAAHAAIIVTGFFVGWIVTRPEPIRPEPIASFFDPGFAAPASAPLDAAPPLADPPIAAASTASALPTLDPPQVSGVSIEQPLMLASAIEPKLPMPTPVMTIESLAMDRRVADVRLLGVRSSNAESIVYVVDATGSMITTMPIVVGQLLNSIEQLSSVQRFQVIFFKEGGPVAAPHPELDPDARATQWLRATTGNKRFVAEWMRGVRTRGRAGPTEALGMALALQPDVVFLLSSGDNAAREPGMAEREGRAVLAQLDALNPVDARSDRRRVPIKVLQFLNADASGLLAAIAEAHGGRDGYKFISREDLGIP